MKKVEELEAYEVLEKREISELNSISYILKHKKTGARVALMSNDDDNKVFYIGFRTPPTDSTGVPHIIEHTVLCGSDEFPVKDPFVELVKGSLNTFLNAMTYPDKTVYPVASCNDKDFQNLMHVYLDAVFHPNIYHEKKIFQQEGWHYELENAEDELKINGVVYNEMKGAFSSSDDVHDREVFNSLFPDTPYGVESGGDPDVIPKLTYEAFLDFHRKYYHPSNSYIYLYGDMDMAEKLTWIDEKYLSHYEALEIDSSIPLQESFTETKKVYKEYPVMEGETLEDNAYLSYNTVVGTSLDRELYIAFQLLDYALCSAPGAPLKMALIDKNIGKDVYSIYENGIYQPYFSIVAKNANAEQEAEFTKTIEDTLQRIVREGLDRKSLLAGLNYFEFKYREADFGSYPKGLMYGLQAFDSWLYDDTKPFIHLEANDTFKKLRERVDTDYYEQLIVKYLLQNRHKSILVVAPKAGLTLEKEQKLAKKLAEYKSSLSKEEIEALVKNTHDLKAYQEQPDSPENMAKIPMLAREDMKKEAEGFINEERFADETLVLYHDVFTNGINYLRFIFDMGNVPKELVDYIGILKIVLGYVDTEQYTYGDLYNEINIQTGGITASVNTYTNAKNLDEYKLTFEVKAKTLFDKTENAFALVKEILLSSKIRDEKRLREIIAEMRSRMQSTMTSGGHSVAAMRAMSYFSEVAAVSEMVSGIPCLRLVERIDADFEHEKENLFAKLEALVHHIFRPENLMVDVTTTEEGYQQIPELVKEFKKSLFTDTVEKKKFKVETQKLNEAFETSGQVQYVCRAGNFIDKGIPYTGALKVLKVIMGYDYLWMNVRVKGGAYGCMSNFGKGGDCYFVSYRDPNLEKTIEVYEQAADYIKNFSADERTITKYIIGAVSDMDIPMTPAMKGARSSSAYLTNLSFEEVQRERDELLAVTEDKIRALAAHIQALLDEKAICVVGNADKIESEKHLFEHVENLFY